MSAIELVDLQIAQAWKAIDQTLQGRLMVPEESEFATRHGIGLVFERSTVDEFGGTDAVLKKFEGTCMKFQVETLHDVAYVFNGIFWSIEPAKLLDHQIANIKNAIDQSLQGRVLSTPETPNATRHGVGLAMEKSFIDQIGGTDAVLKRLRATGVEFKSAEHDDKSICVFNGIYWSMPNPIVPVLAADDAELMMQRNVDSLKRALERTVMGGIWSNTKFEGARRHGLGVLLERHVVDKLGLDHVMKRFNACGLRFVHSETKIGHEVADQFNANFWVAFPKM